jgi:beta-glucanase (GH16 family)
MPCPFSKSKRIFHQNQQVFGRPDAPIGSGWNLISIGKMNLENNLYLLNSNEESDRQPRLLLEDHMRINRRLRIVPAIWIITALFCSRDRNPVKPEEQIPVPEGWKLVWNDEFKGPSIDSGKWEFEVNGKGGGNNELQYYTDRKENAFIENGSLVIQAGKESYEGPDGSRAYTSARIRTRNKGDWKFGRFDIRARLPFGQGMWPAVWMMPTDAVYGSWPASGEIDIMEELGQEPNRVYQTLHFGGVGAHSQTGGSYVLRSGDFSDDFHLFTLEWDSAGMRWFVDGATVQSKNVNSWYTTAAQRPAPFDQRFYLILNLAVGGNWPKSPDATTTFPQRLIVDFVRVFQKAE